MEQQHLCDREQLSLLRDLQIHGAEAFRPFLVLLPLIQGCFFAEMFERKC